MKIFDGKKFSEQILDKIRREAKNRNLKLAVVLIGEDSSSKVFIRIKERACQNTGIGFQLFHFPENTNQVALKEQISRICQNQENSGIVIQLPLPGSMNKEEILNLIPEEKDIDLLSKKSKAKFLAGDSAILPPVVSAIGKILKKEKIIFKNKNTAIVGSGALVGFPLAVWMIRQGATVSALNSKTKDISYYTRKADILVSGTGKPKIIKGGMIKKGAFLIDAGSAVEDGKTIGDIDLKSVSQKASWISSVPGGLGPVTVVCLLENLLKLQKNGGENTGYSE